MILTDRDYKILREVNRWGYSLGRHIKELCGFEGTRATDRRLKLLIEAGYLERKKILYGVPSVYKLTYKGKILIGANKRTEQVRIERIPHDMAVLDTVCFFVKKYQITTDDIISEKDLHSADGFGNRSHKPDFIFTKGGKKHAVEVELTLKAKERLQKNIRDNYLSYDYQIWVVPEKENKIIKLLNEYQTKYDNLEIIFLKEVLKNV